MCAMALEARQLLGISGGTLLDVGAGSGEVTKELGRLFNDVLVTEASAPMARRLARRGYATLAAPDLNGLEALAKHHGVTIEKGLDCIAVLSPG